MRKIEQKSKLQEHRLLKLHKASKNGLFKANERGDITLLSLIHISEPT